MEETLNNGRCARCGESLESQVFKDAFQSLIKLSDGEISSITVKYGGSVCIPCLNQLKTHFKIIKGDYNIKSGENVISG